MQVVLNLKSLNQTIIKIRVVTWNPVFAELFPTFLVTNVNVRVPPIPTYCAHNAVCFNPPDKVHPTNTDSYVRGFSNTDSEE